MPNILLLIRDELTLHDMLTGLAGPCLLMIEGILFAEFQREALPTLAALPPDRHLLGEESSVHPHVERCATLWAYSILEIVRGIVEEAGHLTSSIL